MHIFKKLKKIVSFVLVISCLLSITIPASAASVTRVISGNSQRGRAMRVTTYSTTAAVYGITSSQALHTKGYTTTIGVSSSVSKSCSASATLSATMGANYRGLALSACGSLGVSEQASFTVASSVNYTIDSKTASGRYRIDVVFPRNKTNFYVYNSTAKGNTTILNKTISFMPRPHDAYRKLTRYAGA